MYFLFFSCMKKIFVLVALVALSGVNAAFAHPRNLQRVEQRLEQRLEAVQQRLEIQRTYPPCPRV